jgi:hypothetical protein
LLSFTAVDDLYVFGTDKPETEDKLLCSCCNELFQDRNDQVFAVIFAVILDSE